MSVTPVASSAAMLRWRSFAWTSPSRSNRGERHGVGDVREPQDLERDGLLGLEVERAVDLGPRAPADQRVDPEPVADHLTDPVDAISGHAPTP